MPHQANCVRAPTKPRAVTTPPGHAIVIMTVILVIVRKRRSWNWGVNLHSVGTWKKRKNSKQGEDSCEQWVTLTVDDIEGKNCGGGGGRRASSKCFRSSLMLEVVGICCTPRGPSTQCSHYLTFVSQLHRRNVFLVHRLCQSKQYASLASLRPTPGLQQKG